MENLERILNEINTSLKSFEKIKDTLLTKTRQGIKEAGRAIEKFHAEKKDEVLLHLDEAKKLLKEVNTLLAAEERLKHSNIVHALEQEVVEAATLLSIINRTPIQSPQQLEVTGTGYVLGLTDVVGELRRYCLTQLKKGDSKEAEWGLQQMETLYAELKNPVFPKNVIHNFRRKMDILRGLVERTRGDVITFLTQERLRTTIEGAFKKSD